MHRTGELPEGVTLEAWRKAREGSRELSCATKRTFYTRDDAKNAIKRNRKKGFAGDCGVYPCWHKRFGHEDGEPHWHIYTKAKQRDKEKQKPCT
jgi:hypothetical protein